MKMVDPNSKTQVQSPTLVPMIIWGALLISQLTYVMVATQIIARRKTLPPSDVAAASLFTPLAAIGIVTYVLAIFLPQVLWKVKKGALNSETSSLTELTPVFFVPFIIRLAMFEAVTLFGFILVVAGKEPLNALLPFLGASVLGYLLNFPSESKIRSVFKPAGSTII